MVGLPRVCWLLPFTFVRAFYARARYPVGYPRFPACRYCAVTPVPSCSSGFTFAFPVGWFTLPRGCRGVRCLLVTRLQLPYLARVELRLTPSSVTFPRVPQFPVTQRSAVRLPQFVEFPHLFHVCSYPSCVPGLPRSRTRTHVFARWLSSRLLAHPTLCVQLPRFTPARLLAARLRSFPVGCRCSVYLYPAFPPYLPHLTLQLPRLVTRSCLAVRPFTQLQLPSWLPSYPSSLQFPVTPFPVPSLVAVPRFTRYPQLPCSSALCTHVYGYVCVAFPDVWLLVDVTHLVAFVVVGYGWFTAVVGCSFGCVRLLVTLRFTVWLLAVVTFVTFGSFWFTFGWLVGYVALTRCPLSLFVVRSGSVAVLRCCGLRVELRLVTFTLRSRLDVYVTLRWLRFTHVFFSFYLLVDVTFGCVYVTRSFVAGCCCSVCCVYGWLRLRLSLLQFAFGCVCSSGWLHTRLVWLTLVGYVLVGSTFGYTRWLFTVAVVCLFYVVVWLRSLRLFWLHLLVCLRLRYLLRLVGYVGWLRTFGCVLVARLLQFTFILHLHAFVTCLARRLVAVWLVRYIFGSFAVGWFWLLLVGSVWLRFVVTFTFVWLRTLRFCVLGCFIVVVVGWLVTRTFTFTLHVWLRLFHVWLPVCYCRLQFLRWLVTFGYTLPSCTFTRLVARLLSSVVVVTLVDFWLFGCVGCCWTFVWLLVTFGWFSCIWLLHTVAHTFGCLVGYVWLVVGCCYTRGWFVWLFGYVRSRCVCRFSCCCCC